MNNRRPYPHTKIAVLGVLLLLPVSLSAESFPPPFCAFRDAVYAQRLDIMELMRLYSRAKEALEQELSGAALPCALARAEYLMGIAFRAVGRDGEAAAFFEQGIARAEDSLAIEPSPEGYRLLGTNIAFLCEVRRSWGFSNYGRIEENAGKALALDPGNFAARYLVAAFCVASPWPLGNVRRGYALLKELAGENLDGLESEDRFNLYLMLEAACLKQRRNEEARFWHERSSALYPANTFIGLVVK